MKQLMNRLKSGKLRDDQKREGSSEYQDTKLPDCFYDDEFLGYEAFIYNPYRGLLNHPTYIPYLT